MSERQKLRLFGQDLSNKVHPAKDCKSLKKGLKRIKKEKSIAKLKKIYYGRKKSGTNLSHVRLRD